MVARNERPTAGGQLSNNSAYCADISPTGYIFPPTAGGADGFDRRLPLPESGLAPGPRQSPLPEFTNETNPKQRPRAPRVPQFLSYEEIRPARLARSFAAEPAPGCADEVGLCGPQPAVNVFADVLAPAGFRVASDVDASL
jgi:hypothetical protein